MVPATARGIIEAILKETELTVDNIADEVRCSPQSIVRVLKGGNPSKRLEIALVACYLRQMVVVPEEVVLPKSDRF